MNTKNPRSIQCFALIELLLALLRSVRKAIYDLQHLFFLVSHMTQDEKHISAIIIIYKYTFKDKSSYRDHAKTGQSAVETCFPI